MVLTRDGVDLFRLKLDKDFQQFQARAYHGTDKTNASQKRYPLPTNSTLLDYYRKLRRASGNPNCFLLPKSAPPELSNQMADDFAFVMQMLSEYADERKPAKYAVAKKAREIVRQVNDNRRAAGFSVLIKERSTRTYERWIDL